MNPSSEVKFMSVISNMPQSLLLTGDSRVGLSTIGKYIADTRGIVPIIILPERDEIIDIEKGSISVDSIRRINKEARTKTSVERIIIIDYAERMTHQAQNAFLKILEEPNENLYFILVSNSVSKLLPTVISRVENLEMKKITNEQSNSLIDSIGMIDDKKRSQLLFMAEGLPAELILLSNDEEYFNKRSDIIRDARELLTGSLYKKLLIINKYKDNRQVVLELLNDCANILKKSVINNPQIDSINHIDKLLKTYQRIEANGNIRLCLTQMVMS
ncbi:MAG: hypothetical protein WCK26_04025 [Candidatus Saccharibacteria bacterium]